MQMFKEFYDLFKIIFKNDLYFSRNTNTNMKYPTNRLETERVTGRVGMATE